MLVTARVDKFKLVGQRNQVAAGLIETAVEASEVPQAVLLLVGLVGLIDHDALSVAKGLEMATLFLVPTVHLIAHRFHLLGRDPSGKKQKCYEEEFFHFVVTTRHCEEERRSNPGGKLVCWIASFLAMTLSRLY